MIINLTAAEDFETVSLNDDPPGEVEHESSRWLFSSDPSFAPEFILHDTWFDTVNLLEYTVDLVVPGEHVYVRLYFRDNFGVVSEPGELHINLATRNRTGIIMVEDASGVWKELTDINDTNWVMQADWEDNIDLPSMTATVEAFLAQAIEESLSPLMTASLLNRTIEDTFGPMIQPGRGLRIWMLHEDFGDPDRTMVFDGRIDTIDFANRMVAECRDRYGDIIDRQIEVARTYGAMDPVELIQQMLDDNYNLDPEDEDSPVLYTLNGTDAEPIDPDDLLPDPILLSPFTQLTGSLGEALRTIARLVTYNIGYKRDPANVDQPHRLTIYRVDREKTVPDKEFGPGDYFSINSLKISRIDVRTIVRVGFYTAPEVTVPSFVTVRDNAAVAKYGRRFMLIMLQPGDQINTFDEALALAQIALHDMSEPFASKEAVMPLYWQGSPGDLYNFLPNNIHYDEPLLLSPIVLKHSVRVDGLRTTMSLRGNIVGAFRDWLNMERRGVEISGEGSGSGDVILLYRGNDDGDPEGPTDEFGRYYFVEASFELPEGGVAEDYELLWERVVVPTYTWEGASYPFVVGEPVAPLTLSTAIPWTNPQVHSNEFPPDWYWVDEWSVYVALCDITWTVKLIEAGDPGAIIAIGVLTVSNQFIMPPFA